jgi:hypothetical protein
VVVARTGNVPEATAHGRLVEQFAAPRHANAAHLASNATITVNAIAVNAIAVNAIAVNAIAVNAIAVNAIAVNAIAVNAIAVNATKPVKTFHADPIQDIKLSQTSDICVRLHYSFYHFFLHMAIL